MELLQCRESREHGFFLHPPKLSLDTSEGNWWQNAFKFNGVVQILWQFSWTIDPFATKNEIAATEGTLHRSKISFLGAKGLIS